MKLFMIIDSPGINFMVFIDTKAEMNIRRVFKLDINVDL